MPRHCTVCHHPELAAIEREMLDPTISSDAIAAHYHLSKAATGRHRRNHFKRFVQRTLEERHGKMPAAPHRREIAAEVIRDDQRLASRKLDIYEELQVLWHRVRMAHDACDEWLRDPENPERYDLGPRAEEITVIYTEPNESGNGSLRRRERLSALLARIREGGVRPTGLVSYGADHRTMLLAVHDRMAGELELLARLTGQLQPEKTTVNVLVNPQWIELKAAIVGALDPYPEAKQAVLNAIGRLASGE